MTRATTWLDWAIAIWAIAACGGFVLALLPGLGQTPELELVGRCVYLVVIVAGIAGLALRAIGKVRR